MPTILIPNNNLQSGSFKSSQSRLKLFVLEAIQRRWWPRSLEKRGHVATIALEDRRTINTERYNIVCLPQIIAELRKSNSKRRIILHHDNASSHSARQTIEYLKQEKVEILDHPLYSPDLSPNDFFTFPKIKKSSWSKVPVW